MMAGTYLEQLVAEWYELQGYFVRRNVLVGRRSQGGYEGELDVVAFDPRHPHLVHAETSMDATSWADRDRRFKRKFEMGRTHVHDIFPGVMLPSAMEQFAVFAYASKRSRDTVGGHPFILVSELLQQIFEVLKSKRMASSAIPEHLPLLRTCQFISDHRGQIMETWGDGSSRRA